MKQSLINTFGGIGLAGVAMFVIVGIFGMLFTQFIFILYLIYIAALMMVFFGGIWLILIFE